LDRIRDLNDVPVLMPTALASDRVKERARNAGADDYLAREVVAIDGRDVRRGVAGPAFGDMEPTAPTTLGLNSFLANNVPSTAVRFHQARYEGGHAAAFVG
jgi:hypothetical protein